LPLHFVKVADLAEDPGGPLLRLALHEGFMELPSRMRPASGKVDVPVVPNLQGQVTHPATQEQSRFSTIINSRDRPSP
jgi:hypothetical protein